MSVSRGPSERDLNSGRGYNYSLYGESSRSSSNPYANFTDHLENDPNPNFLRYTLLVLERSVMGQQAELLKTIRKKMEEKYNLPNTDVWSPLQIEE